MPTLSEKGTEEVVARLHLEEFIAEVGCVVLLDECIWDTELVAERDNRAEVYNTVTAGADVALRLRI